MKDKNVFKFIWYFSKKYKFRILFLFLIMFISTISTTYLAPCILKIFINLYESKQLTLSSGIFYMVLYIIFISATPIFLIFENKLFLISEELIKKDILSDTFSFLLTNDINYFNENYSGDLSSKLIGLIEGFNEIFNAFLYIFELILFLCIVLTIIFNFNFYMFIITILWIVLFYYSLKKSIKIRTERFKVSSEAENKSAGIINDCLMNISNIKSFCTEKREIRNVRRQSLNIIRSLSKTIGISSIFMGIVYVMSNSYFFIMLSFLFYQLKSSEISLGEFMFMFQIFITLTGFIRNGLTNIIEINPVIAKFQNSLDKLLVEPKIKDKKDAKKLEVKEGRIVFRNVKFSYYKQK